MARSTSHAGTADEPGGDVAEQRQTRGRPRPRQADDRPPTAPPRKNIAVCMNGMTRTSSPAASCTERERTLEVDEDYGKGGELRRESQRDGSAVSSPGQAGQRATRLDRRAERYQAGRRQQRQPGNLDDPQHGRRHQEHEQGLPAPGRRRARGAASRQAAATSTVAGDQPCMDHSTGSRPGHYRRSAAATVVVATIAPRRTPAGRCSSRPAAGATPRGDDLGDMFHPEIATMPA